jgi:hypothetical protein
MTVRSIIMGALAGLVICAACFFNDFVIKQRMLIPHQMPAVLYGSLILGVLGAMLAGRWAGRRWALSGAEWAVIAGLGLVACGIPGWGLVQDLVPTAIMTHHYARLQPSWRSADVDVVQAVPAPMLVDVTSLYQLYWAPIELTFRAAPGEIMIGWPAGSAEFAINAPLWTRVLP